MARSCRSPPQPRQSALRCASTATSSTSAAHCGCWPARKPGLQESHSSDRAALNNNQLLKSAGALQASSAPAAFAMENQLERGSVLEMPGRTGRSHLSKRPKSKKPPEGGTCEAEKSGFRCPGRIRRSAFHRHVRKNRMDRGG